MKKIIKQIQDCIDRDGIIYVCGNGGSSAEADHMVSEFVTHGIRAVSLMNPATITAIANDFEYNRIFAEQIKTMCKHNDLVISLSTSGKSGNVLKAEYICSVYEISYLDWPRKGKDTAEIQEYQLRLMHKVYKKLCG